MVMTADPPRLTPTERAVFDCIMQGTSEQQIASRLALSVHTVKEYKARIREKLGGTDAGQGWWIMLARAYERNGGELPV